MLHGTRSHPTQLFSTLYDKLANVLTSNGFCFCVDSRDCQATGSGTCSLLDTVRSMYDSKFRTTKLLTQSNSVCTQQLDWPFAGGLMRDLMTSQSRYDGQNATETAAGTCNVFDRLPPFQYRYAPAGKVAKPPDGKTSLSEGGACHMGRPPRLPKRAMRVDTHLCRKIHTNHTHIVARCFGASGSMTYTDYEMQRELSAAPDWMVEQMKKERIRCNSAQCNAAQSTTWKTESRAANMPHGAEVSYGVPFRWSATRLLASDMRAALCSTLNGSGSRKLYHNDSIQCDSLLNLGSWTVDKFLRSYSDSTFAELLQPTLQGASPPPSLLEMHQHMMGVVKGTFAGAGSIMQRADEDGLLWSGADAPGWVACNQRNGTCYGKLPKEQWYSSSKAQVRASMFFLHHCISKTN